MKPLNFLLLTSALLAGTTATAFAVVPPNTTPVMFTTNEVVNDQVVALNGPYRVSYITVYVDGVKKCYTESNGNCTATLQLTPGLHTATYVWATCNNPASCPHYGEVTHYVNIPDQDTPTYAVRIPTAKVQFNASYGTGIGLNQVFRGWALGGGKYVANHMSGCYTTDYRGYYPNYPAWPTLPAAPEAIDPGFQGFSQVCIGSSDTYPAPSGTGPHVVIPYPF
jgi:hypothetical protein